MTRDVAIAWDRQRGRGDWVLKPGEGLATGAPIVSAVLVSLFTDARAPADVALPDGSDDRRGWWGDSYRRRPIGSMLWLYERAKKAGDGNLPLAIRRACEAALQWLLDEGVAASVSVATGWIGPQAIGIRIEIVEPDGTATPFDLSWTWEGA